MSRENSPTFFVILLLTAIFYNFTVGSVPTQVKTQETIVPEQQRQEYITRVADTARIPEWVVRTVLEESSKRNLPTWKTALVLSIIWPESRGNPRALSYSGAIGLMQIMPFHHKRPRELYKPRVNINKGIDVLNYCLQKHNGNITQAIRGYNIGPHHWTVRRNYSVSVLAKRIEYLRYRVNSAPDWKTRKVYSRKLALIKKLHTNRRYTAKVLKIYQELTGLGRILRLARRSSDKRPRPSV